MKIDFVGTIIAKSYVVDQSCYNCSYFKYCRLIYRIMSCDCCEDFTTEDFRHLKSKHCTNCTYYHSKNYYHNCEPTGDLSDVCEEWVSNICICGQPIKPGTKGCCQSHSSSAGQNPEISRMRMLAFHQDPNKHAAWKKQNELTKQPGVIRKIRNTMQNYWNTMDTSRYTEICKTLQKVWDIRTIEEREAIAAKIAATWSEEDRRIWGEVRSDWYNALSEQEKEKLACAKSQRQKEYWADLTPDEYRDRCEQISDGWTKEAREKQRLWRISLMQRQVILPGNKRKPNKPERRLLHMFPCLQYVGNEAFWVRIGKSSRNPDFLVPPFSTTRKIVEVFGDYYHTTDEAQWLLQGYASLGFSCLIIWVSSLESTRDNIAQYINHEHPSSVIIGNNIFERE